MRKCILHMRVRHIVHSDSAQNSGRVLNGTTIANNTNDKNGKLTEASTTHENANDKPRRGIERNVCKYDGWLVVY